MMGYNPNKYHKLLSLLSQKNVSNVYLAKAIPMNLPGTFSYQATQIIHKNFLITNALANKSNVIHKLKQVEYSTGASNESEISSSKKSKPIDPNSKPTLEQLLLVEERMKAHVRLF